MKIHRYGWDNEGWTCEVECGGCGYGLIINKSDLFFQEAKKMFEEGGRGDRVVVTCCRCRNTIVVYPDVPFVWQNEKFPRKETD